MAFLLSKEALAKQAAELLGVSAKSLQWNGYSLADWQADFKRRAEILAYEGRKAQLDATRAKLNTLVSEEARTEMELNELEKML